MLNLLKTSFPKARWITDRLTREILLFSELGKYRIATLVSLTNAVGYVANPHAELTSTLIFSTAGVYLTASSAAHLNQILERRQDSLMHRTKNRPLVINKCSVRRAAFHALISGCVGLAIMWLKTNPVATGLAGFNIVLYAFIYTPLKQITPFNTEIGSIVGALPPLIGWTSAALDCCELGYEAMILPGNSITRAIST